MLSQTAKSCDQLSRKNYKLSNYYHFTLSERGKTREIDAPKVQDRQVYKAYTQNVLLPLYTPYMIYNNGASLKYKGLTFAIKELEKSMRNHYRHFGRDGYIILADYKQFFPTAPHETIYAKHKKIILDSGLRNFADDVVNRLSNEKGLPIGVEPSQIEMVALPSMVDNYMTCQLGLRNYGHYMDDFYMIIPPYLDPHEILEIFIKLSENNGFNINRSKTRIIPITKSFKFCKVKFRLTETGKVLKRYSNKIIYRAKRKLKGLYRLLLKGEITYLDLWSSVNGVRACLQQYACHNQLLKLYRIFYSIFGFSCMKYEDFERKDILNGLYLSHEI